MRALWSDRPNCSHNVSQKVKRIRHVSENYYCDSELLRRSVFSTAGSFGQARKFPNVPRGGPKIKKTRDSQRALRLKKFNPD